MFHFDCKYNYFSTIFCNFAEQTAIYMILFPNAKINIGLRILRKRSDGYHDIETVMVPVPWCDILEIVPGSTSQTTFTVLGDNVPDIGAPADNLVVKAVRAVEKFIGRELPALDIFLTKNIPSGAGMGGGSADAAFTIIGLNRLLNLGLTTEQMATIAAGIGADCPFFIYNRPMLACGIGERLTPVELPVLDDLYAVIVKQNTESVSTAAAYAGTTLAPQGVEGKLVAELGGNIADWSPEIVTNDFEKSIFALRPGVASLKEAMMSKPALCPLYCAMSGSGSAVFALYKSDKLAEASAAALRQDYADAAIKVCRLSSKGID